MRCAGGSEARVELNDELLVDVLLHLITRGEADDRGLKGLGVHREPTGDVANPVFLEAARAELAGRGRILDLNLVTWLHIVAGNVDLVAVDADVTVINELAGSRTALGEPEQVNRAVETGFKELEETFAGDATLALGDFKNAAELALQQAVNETELLLLIESDSVFGELATHLRAVNAGRVAAAFKSFAGAKDESSEAATDASGRAGITSHGKGMSLRVRVDCVRRLDAATFAGAAAVVRNRRYIHD